jgi:hypothetical protein
MSGTAAGTHFSTPTAGHVRGGCYEDIRLFAPLNENTRHV